MANAEEEVLNFRINGGPQARQELDALTKSLEKHNAAVADGNRVAAAGGTMTKAQSRAYQEATLPSGTFGATAFNLADTAKAAQRNIATVNDSERALKEKNTLLDAQMNRPQMREQQDRFKELSARHVGDHITPAVKKELDDLHAQIQTRLSDAERAVTPTKVAQATQVAAASIDQYKSLTDTMYRVPYKNAAKSLDTEVRARMKAGMPMSLHEYAEKRQTYNGGEFVTPDNDPYLKEDFDHSHRSPMQRTGAFLRKAMSRENIFSGSTGFAAGYAALSLGESAAQAADQATFISGERQTPEAFQRSMAGLAPAGVGLALSPFGPGASMIGAGVASAGTGVFDSMSKAREDLRMAAEEMSRAMGKGAAATTALSTSLENAAKQAGTPLVELAQSAAALGRTAGVLTPEGVGQQTRLQQLMGDFYPQAASANNQFMSSAPFTTGYQRSIRTGAGLTEAFNGAAMFEALSGNRDAAQKQAMQAGAEQMSPGYAQATANVTAARNFQDDPNPLVRFARNLPFLGGTTRRMAAEATAAAIPESQRYTIAPGEMSEAIDRIVDTVRPATDALGANAAAANASAALSQQAMQAGQGLAGMRQFAPGQRAALGSEQSNLSTVLGQYQAALRRPGLDDEGRTRLRAAMNNIKEQIAGVRGQQQGVEVGLFREGLSEEESTFSTGYSRLGTAGSLDTLMGGSVFGRVAQANVAARRGALGSRAGTLEALAADRSNYLAPQEREADVAQAAQMRMQRQAILNQEQMQRIGERQSQSGLRTSVVGISAAEAQTRGTASSVYAEETARLNEQHRLQVELNAEMARGNLTVEQKLGLQTRINDMVAQEKVGRIAVRNTLIESLQAQTGAAAQGMATRAGRLDTAEGSSAAAVRARLSNYAESQNKVAIAQAQYLTDPNPRNRTANFADLEARRAELQQSGMEATRVVESPQERTARAQMQGTMERQNISIFEPGAPITEAARLNKMDAQRMRAIQQRRVLLRSQGMLQPEAEEQLVAQEEPIRTQMLERQNMMNLGWMDRLTAQSMNAPSFASRVMPPPSDIAALAEKRGLGAMSSRLFGFTKRTSYDAAQMLGFMPADVSRMAFGHRPGDFPDAGGGSPFGMAGDGGPLSAGQVLPSSPLGSGSTDKQLTDVLSMLAGVITKGLVITVHIPEPSTGRVASQTVNAGQNQGSQGLMRGGAAPRPGSGTFVPTM